MSFYVGPRTGLTLSWETLYGSCGGAFMLTSALSTRFRIIVLKSDDNFGYPTLQALKCTAALFVGYPLSPRQMNPINSLSSHLPNLLKFSHVHVTPLSFTTNQWNRPSPRWYNLRSCNWLSWLSSSSFWTSAICLSFKLSTPLLLDLDNNVVCFPDLSALLHLHRCACTKRYSEISIMTSSPLRRRVILDGWIPMKGYNWNNYSQCILVHFL